jgi:hypothetical protein
MRFTVARTPIRTDTPKTTAGQLTQPGQLGLTPMRLQYAFEGRIAWEKWARRQAGVLSTLDSQCDEHESNYLEVDRFGTAGVEQTYIV